MKEWKPKTIAEVEKKLILKTLEYFNGDKVRAATALGVSVRTVMTKLKQYNNPVAEKPTIEPFKRPEYTINMIDLKCSYCGVAFQKDLLTYEFLVKYGHNKFYCCTAHEKRTNNNQNII